MAYEKQTWVNRVVSEGTGQVVEHGTIVSAERLNHLEDGVFNAHEAIPTKTSQLTDDVNFVKVDELSTKVDLSGLWSHEEMSIATLAEAEAEIDKNIPSAPESGGGESIVDTVARLIQFKNEMEAGERQIVIENLEVIE